MRKILAIALVSIAAAASAQSYEDRARAEQLMNDLARYDQVKMDEARRKVAQERRAKDTPAASDKNEVSPWVMWSIVAAGVAVIALFGRSRKP